MSEQASSLLPDLLPRQAALQAELEKEREMVVELAACDPQEISDYRAAINEQKYVHSAARRERLTWLITCSSAIASFRKDLSEATIKLSDQTSKLEKLCAVKAEHTTAIISARGRCDRFTRSDVIRLQGVFEAAYTERPG